LANKRILAFHEIDLVNPQQVESLFKIHTNICAILHFAGMYNPLKNYVDFIFKYPFVTCLGKKSISDSWENPLEYYEINQISTLNLLKYYIHHRKTQQTQSPLIFLFSSSACVYGDAPTPISENVGPLQPENPYARSKRIIEDMIQDVCYRYGGRDLSRMVSSEQSNEVNSVIFHAAILRYFNPVG
jgi:UDP-glucose 4-epimerase